MTDTSTKGRPLLIFPPNSTCIAQLTGKRINNPLGILNSVLQYAFDHSTYTILSFMLLLICKMFCPNHHIQFHFHIVVRNIRCPATIACSRRTWKGLKWEPSVGLVLSLIRSQPSLSRCPSAPLGNPPFLPGLQPNQPQVNLAISAHVRFMSVGPWLINSLISKGPICYEGIYCTVS